MHSSNLELRSTFGTVALALMLVMLWLLMQGYHGLTGDGQIYAFQAMARLHPYLATDLYLQNTSQDRFTLFSPFYAWCIELLGLENAARMLTVLFTLWFLAAVWGFARAVAGWNAGWAAVALLLIVAGNYGGSDVFRVLEPFLTARLPAQALIVTALYCQARGRNWLGLSLALAALLIHPLMALPGLLLLISLWLPLRLGVIGAIGGVCATLAVCVTAAHVPYSSRVLTVMDAPWLEVVRERSQFLFLQLWSARDWCTNLRPFVCLGFTAIVLPDDRIRKLCAAAALVGAAGLAVALIGSLLGPVAILVQGQGWRWVWITVLVGVVLFPPTVLQAARDEECGLLCALLLVLGWTLQGLNGINCVGLATIVWLMRSHLGSRAASYFRWAFAALGIAVAVWIFIECRTLASPPTVPSVMWLTEVKEIFALKIPAAVLVALIAWALRASRAIWAPVLLSAMIAGFSVLILPAAFKESRPLASSSDIQEFADWAKIIPPTGTVLVAPSRDVGTFVWFTLDRPNYLALDQSAGVVFSRTTALEIRRRSEVLLPIMDPGWKILTRLRSRSVSGHQKPATTRPLTTKNLIQVCTDPQLGFVISPDKVGFDPLPHKHAGAWKNWNLYDCRKVRSAQSVT